MFSVAEVIAVRRDLCALIRCQVTLADQATEFLTVFRNDTNGVVQRSVLFDIDDLDAALAELDLIQMDTDTIDPTF